MNICYEKCLEVMKNRYGFFTDAGLLNSRVKPFCERVCNNVTLHWKGRTYGEDALLFHALPVLIDIHGKDAHTSRYAFGNIDVYVHKVLNNIEIDALIVFTKKITTIRKYSIIVELKETDLFRMIQQLVVRRKLATWAYGVIGLEPNTVIRMLFHNDQWLKTLIDYGIGVISMYGNIPVVILESSRRKLKGTLEQFIQQPSSTDDDSTR